MQLVIQQRPDGQTEIVAAGQSFLVRKDPPEVPIPKELLQDLLLSELPDQIGVKPLGVSLIVAGGEQVDCWLYAFQDGYACARIQVTTKAGPNARLRALREAVSERQEKQEDVEPTDSDQPEYSGLCFLLDLVEDIPIQEALDRVERVLKELDSRCLALLAAQQFRQSAAT